LRRYKLSDEDRERLGLPEWIDFDYSKLLMTEAEALESAGYETDQFIEDLAGYEVVDKAGNPVMVAVLEEDGSPSLDGDGKPMETVKLRFPIRAHRAAVWIAARRVGCTVSYDDFDFDLAKIKSEMTLPGKDPEPDPASPS
jgi:hypothetical protein